MKKLVTTFDGEKKITLSDGFISALESVGKELLKMMREQDAEFADCWSWCVIEVRDLSSTQSIAWRSGAAEDKPAGMKGEVEVVIYEKGD